jgi:hypothetical protein
MSEVKFVIITISNPTSSNPMGVVEEGWYTVDGGKVTLTTCNGTPLYDQRNKQYSVKLKQGDDPRNVAAKLTRQWTSTKRRGSDFSRPINYPRIVVA